METSIHKRKRILLHFILGIGLPSLLLGYLAFRGVKNDLALIEKERLNKHNAIVQQITESINQKITTVEETFLDSILKYDALQQDPSVFRSLEHLKKQQPLVEEVFLFENAKHIQLPFAKLLYLPGTGIKSLPEQSQTSALLQGQQYEYQEKRLQEALLTYQQVFSQSSDSELKGKALNAIARVQKKSNLFSDAIKSYTKIAKDYNDFRLGSGLPSGLISQLELGNLFLKVDDPNKAAQTFIHLYEDLIRAKWPLEKSQYEFFTGQVENSIEEIFSQDPTTQSYKNKLITLKNEENKEREITERLLAFQENAIPNLQARVPRRGENLYNVFKRYTLDIGGYVYFVSILVKHEGNRNQVEEIWGFLLNSEQFKTNLLQTVIQQHISIENIHWIVKGRDNQTILQSDMTATSSMTVRANFVGNFPPWTLEFYQQTPPLFKTLLTSRRSIYLYMFILLGGILIFGLTLTIRIVSRELELGKMKSDFVSTVSHEFKSPLTSIRQLAEMLQTGRIPSEEHRQRYYDVLLEQSERLSLLIDKILDFAKMEEGKKEFEFETVDMGPLLEELVSTIQQQVQHEGFTIKAKFGSHLLPIQADRAAMTQVITNLIDNAIKYSAESKNVSVRGFMENQYLVIAVQDLGIGIQPEEVDKIFDRFYRGGDELTRTIKGSGLGLTLVKQIIEAHKGSVHVESKLGKGSTFSIRLPVETMEIR